MCVRQLEYLQTMIICQSDSVASCFCFSKHKYTPAVKVQDICLFLCAASKTKQNTFCTVPKSVWKVFIFSSFFKRLNGHVTQTHNVMKDQTKVNYELTDFSRLSL